MTTIQLRLLKWISAIATVGGGTVVLLLRQHSIPESLVIASALAVPFWTLLHLAQKGLLPRSSKSSHKTQLNLALICLLLQPPLIMMNVMSHDYFLAGTCVVALGSFVHLVIHNARKLKESNSQGEVGPHSA